MWRIAQYRWRKEEGWSMIGGGLGWILMLAESVVKEN